MSAPPLPVTFVVDYLATGGAERHAVTLANSLDRSRFAVSFAQLKPGGPLLKLLDTGRLARNDCADVARKLDFDAVDRLAGQLRDAGSRLVVAANPYATLYAMLAARRITPRPVVVSTFHSTIMPGVKNQVQMLFYRLMYAFCDCLVYVCQNQRDYWRRRALRARTETVIHNGIDAAHFSAAAVPADDGAIRRTFGFGAEDFVVGICAVLRPEKAHADLLQAIARLRAAGVPARCLVVGDGPERARLEAEIARLGLGADVAITGYQMDVRPYVAACDAMVLASHSVETFSLSALESMAMEKPMVMTRTGGASEQVEHGRTGFLYEPGDIDGLAGHLRALADRAVSRPMGRLAAGTVRERFTLGQMIAAYSTLLERLGAASRVRTPT
jgi:glycosyltransferase involved in cell wall biosynthesis